MTDRRALTFLSVAAGLTLALVAALVLRPWAAVAGEGRWAGPPGDWERVWVDEFSGSSLDRALWRPDRGGDDAARPFNPVPEAAWFDPSNVTVADGLLTLAVEAEPRTVGDREYPFSSGMVQTTPSVALSPPTYVEARIRFPGCDGCWPAFWLHPYDRWPPEIDVAEFLESGSEARPSFNYISPDEDRTGPSMYGHPDVDYRDEFHLYGVLWDGSRAVPYLDGVAYDAVTASSDMTDLPMMIILNLSLRGGYDLRPGVAMDVDWVRVWAPAPAG